MGKRPEPPPDEGESWLVSYADMMTLIACFFILMMAFANYDPVGFNEKAKEFSESFSGAGKGKTDKISEYDLTYANQEVAKHELQDRMKISLKDSELIVTFSSSITYQNESVELEDDGKETLDALIDILKDKNMNYRILIEGHSDDELSKYESQWEVSLKRAAKVASRFESFGFPKHNIVPLGRADTQKAVKSIDKLGNRDDTKARLNRRVVIRVLEPYKKKRIKMGLGVYFKDATEEVDDQKIDVKEKEQFKIE